MVDVILDLLELVKVSIFKPKQKNLDLSKFGVNAFYNQQNLGTITEQSSDIESLGVSKIRVLFDWNDSIQSAEKYSLNLSFYDDIIRNVPKESQILIVLTGCPEWNKNKKDPIANYLKYIKLIAQRYKNNPNVLGFQIHNEPNNPDFHDNVVYGFSDPVKYVDFLSKANAEIKKIKSSYFVTNAATTSIIQNYPDTLKYNKELVKYGVLEHIDAFAFHYYGKDYLNFYRPDGAYRFLKSLKVKSLICTEIGSDEPTNHASYALEKIPYISNKLPTTTSFFWYQYDGGGTTKSYGLRPNESTLYKHLKKS